MPKHRFYIPPEQWEQTPLALTENEAYHCTHVLRLGVDDKIALFNGRGDEATAQITSLEGARVLLDILQKEHTPALPQQLRLAQAIPKGKNMDLIIQKATEIGASEIIPILSDRVIVRYSEEDKEQKRQKWRQVAIEAAKQCGRNWLPEIALPISTKDFFREPLTDDLPLIASLQSDARHGKTILEDYRSEHGNTPQSVLVFIGPEGDFTPAEVALAKSAGCRPMTLGPIVLRTETAAIYSLSVLGYEIF